MLHYIITAVGPMLLKIFNVENNRIVMISGQKFLASGASTIQDASSLQTGFYSEGPKLRLPQWCGANCGDNQKPKDSVYWSIHLFTLGLRSGTVSVQPQLSLEAG